MIIIIIDNINIFFLPCDLEKLKISCLSPLLSSLEMEKLTSFPSASSNYTGESHDSWFTLL